MKHQPWEESLDLDDENDDGDLPFLLRPCKQQQHQQSISQFPLNHQLDSTISQSIPYQTLEYSHSQFQQQSLAPAVESKPASTTSFSHRIPGPAGVLQDAIHRRMACKNQKKPYEEEEEEDLISTQEYIRRVVENGDEHDDDFTGSSWAAAVEFVAINGLGDGKTIGTSISAIKDGLPTYRISQIVAMVKLCTPNGLGDIRVTLKDPSGTIEGSVHRKVLNEEEYGKNISVGAVMILKEVVVFSPTRTSFYLNITLGNMIKVIPKDCKQNSSASSSSSNHSASDLHMAYPDVPEKGCSPLRGRIESIFDKVRVSAVEKEPQIKTVEKEPNVEREDFVEIVIPEVAVTDHTTNNGLGNQSLTNSEACVADRFNTTTVLPQWTDEQLNELFDMDTEF